MQHKAEFVIIGGGIVGISMAYFLAQKGCKDVVLLERDIMLGNGSTSRSAGGIRAQFSSEINIKLQKEALKLFERFEEEVGGHLEYRQYGYMFLATAPEHVEIFKKNMALQRSLGLDVEELATAEVHKRAPYVNVEDVLCGTFYARDGYADPHGAVEAYRERCKQLGTNILFQTEVTGFRKNASGDTILAALTNHGEIEGEVFINCAGAWSGAVGEMADADIPVQPYRRMLFITKPFPTDIVSERMPMIVDFKSGVYMRRESGGFLIGEDDDDEPPSFNTNVDWNFMERVMEHALHRIPALEQAEILRGWAGLYDTSPDHHAVVGKVPHFENFYVISGFSGHGFMQGPIASKLLAELLVDGKPSMDLTPLRIERIKEGKLLHETNII